MTSISSTSASSLFQTQRQPPAGKNNPLAQAIDGGVSDGTISAADGTALTGALDSIGANLQSDLAGATNGAGSAAPTKTRLDPSQIQSKVDGLIDDQVTGGSLTTDQADTLKKLFESNSPSGGGSSKSATASSGRTSTDAIAATGTDGSASATSASDLLDSFIKTLQSAQAQSYGYASSGSAGGTTGNAQALLFDFES